MRRCKTSYSVMVFPLREDRLVLRVGCHRWWNPQHQARTVASDPERHSSPVWPALVSYELPEALMGAGSGAAVSPARPSRSGRQPVSAKG